MISALAFDQRGSLNAPWLSTKTRYPTVAQMEELKVLVAEELTPFATFYALDPEAWMKRTHENEGIHSTVTRHGRRRTEQTPVERSGY